MSAIHPARLNQFGDNSPRLFTEPRSTLFLSTCVGRLDQTFAQTLAEFTRS